MNYKDMKKKSVFTPGIRQLRRETSQLQERTVHWFPEELLQYHAQPPPLTLSRLLPHTPRNRCQPHGKKGCKFSLLPEERGSTEGMGKTISLLAHLPFFRACLHTSRHETRGWRETINPGNAEMLDYEMTDFQTGVCQGPTT